MKHLHHLLLALAVLIGGCATQPDTTGPSGQPGVMPDVPVTELRPVRVTALDTPHDLWDRIRRGFALPELDTELVQHQQQWYLERPDYIERMVERSRLYLFHIVEQLELRGMPSELALLPYIESAFNPQAVSSARAAGMWQFMPATGTAFKLHQNAWRDDRRDVLASTDAALDYLQQLHQRFGDWHLALAAYNWGQGNVGRAITRNHEAGLGTGYLDLDMPAETRHYVPKLQAVKNIIANPEALGATLPPIGNHPFFDTVRLAHNIDIEVAASLAEVPLDEFKALNPSHNKPLILASGTPNILLPWDNAGQFKTRLAEMDPDTLSSWQVWHAPANLRPPQAAQRSGTPLAELRRINGLGPRTLIRKGTPLLVPRPKATRVAAVTPKALPRAAQPQTRPEQTSSSPAAPRAVPAAKPVLKRTIVRARRGDTVASVAARHDLPTQTVADWNKLRPDAAFKAGHELVLFLPTADAPSTRTAARKP